jgi:hypothetical protein
MTSVKFPNKTKVITFRSKSIIEVDHCEVASISWETNSVNVPMPKYTKLAKSFSNGITLVAAHYGLKINYISK